MNANFKGRKKDKIEACLIQNVKLTFQKMDYKFASKGNREYNRSKWEKYIR